MRVKYTKELLEDAVRNSTTWAAVCRLVGVKPMTGSQTHLKKRALEYGIDHSHFVGSAFNTGRVFGPKQPIEVLLVENSSAGSHYLRKRLIKEGLKEAKCEDCGITEWQGEPAPLELDHKNSNNSDCKFENLQILCPNCHASKTRKSRKERTLH